MICCKLSVIRMLAALRESLCAFSAFSASLRFKKCGPIFYRRDAENAEIAQRISHWRCSLALRIKERRLDHSCANLMSDGFNRDLKLHSCTWPSVLASQSRQRDHLLQCWRPRARGCLAYLHTLFIDWNGHAGSYR